MVYTDPERAGRGLADGSSPNAQQTSLNSTQPAGWDTAWEEYTDPKTKKKYWHNKVTNEVRLSSMKASMGDVGYDKGNEARNGNNDTRYLV